MTGRKTTHLRGFLCSDLTARDSMSGYRKNNIQNFNADFIGFSQISVRSE